MKRAFLILLVLSAVLFAACEADPLENLFDIWDDETVAATGNFDFYDTTHEPIEEESEEDIFTELPSVELPTIPG